MQTLKVLLGTYPHTAAIKSGTLASPHLRLDFVEYNPVWDGFKAMIREEQFDVAEMAAVTYLIAKAHGKDLALLPSAMIGRFQHPFALANAAKGVKGPADLAGRRVGIRSFTTTTGAWLRGILANDYGVDLDAVRWVTFEDPHVAEYVDTTERAGAGKAIVPMLLAGELDAVLGERSDDPRAKPLFENPDEEARRWYGRHHVVPINHLVVMRGALLRQSPDTVRAVYDLLLTGKKAAGAPASGPDPLAFGIEAHRASLDLLARYCFQQQLIPYPISVDEMFAGTAELLGT